MADQSSTLKVEDLEEGKRYKVSFEGKWSGEWLTTRGASFYGGGLEGSLHSASSIERLPDPEPEWRYGAVVKVPGRIPFQWADPSWYVADGYTDSIYNTYVSDAWKAGTLEILYQPGE